MSIDALFSSKKHNWRTPRWLFEQLDREFGFGLDAAASADNRLCEAYLGPDNSRPECRDALTGAPWRTFADAVFLNPPYGREVGAFLARAFEQSRQGCTVVCLVFARTETTWWQDYVMRAAQVRFIRGRLSFLDPDTGRPTGPATAPSAVVVFAPWSEGPPAFTTMLRPRLEGPAEARRGHRLSDAAASEGVAPRQRRPGRPDPTAAAALEKGPLGP